MSRSLTATQIISQGDYLDNDFDPNTLTVSQLLGVLTHHQIRYPTPYTKAKLVQLFLDEIKPKAAKFRKEKLKKENSLASDDGITDGLTGRPLNADNKVTRRSSRRLSRAPEDSELPQRPEPPKRRRSSAQPDLGGRVPSAKSRINVPTLVEESEPEEGEQFPRKAARKEGQQLRDNDRDRRISVADDSGWEDNNIFQSGAESSSPARASPVRRTSRKDTTHKKSRHSMSAPPQFSPPSSPTKPRIFPQSPPQSNFEPQLPSDILHRQAFRSPPSSGKRTMFTFLGHDSSPSPAIGQPPPFRVTEVDSKVADFDYGSATPPVDVSGVGVEPSMLDEQVTSAPQGIPNAIVQHESGAKRRPYLLTFLYGIWFLVFSSIVINYKRESASIGFCDATSNSSRALQELQVHISKIEPCVLTNRSFLGIPLDVFDALTSKEGTRCQPLPMIPLPHPSTCAPCPEYASCDHKTVTCNNGYLLRPHPVLALLSPFGAAPSTPVEWVWNLISEVADGLPGLGPVAFPPHCIEDPKRKRNIGALGRAIEALLGQERGRRVCAGGEGLTISDSEGGEARKWGLEVDELRETMKKKTAPHLLDTFDDTFNEAMQQLVEWGSVVFSEDMSGHRYLAHKSANLTLNCKLTVKVRELWSQWRATLFVLFATTCFLYALRRSRAQRHMEHKRVAELVQIALDTLRNQELAHHTDPVTAPQPYLSSLQLRDLVLQEEHSISARKRLWDQVERVVEGNANIRVNLEEIQGGDEHRVWRWVGSTGRGSEHRKRVQVEAE